MSKALENRLWGVAALLLGLAGIVYSGRIILLAADQQGWVSARAEVVTAHVTRSVKGSGFRQYRDADFVYRYEVDGRAHSASRYSFRSAEGSSGEGTANYAVGDALTIFHHPRRHQIAVVERVSPSPFVWLIAIVALVVAARGAAMIRTGRAADGT